MSATEETGGTGRRETALHRVTFACKDGVRLDFVACGDVSGTAYREAICEAIRNEGFRGSFGKFATFRDAFGNLVSVDAASVVGIVVEALGEDEEALASDRLAGRPSAKA